VFQIGFPTFTNFIQFLFHFYLFPALEIDFEAILIWKTCRVGPTCQPAFLIAPGPCARVPPPVGAHVERSAPQAATASSLPHLVRSHGRPHIFLTTPKPPLARVRPSTEASHPHGAASFAVEFQSAHCPRAGPSSNRAPDRRPDRARCPRAAVGPRSPHRPHHRAELTDATD
jgi:hypothetical protein